MKYGNFLPPSSLRTYFSPTRERFLPMRLAVLPPASAFPPLFHPVSLLLCCHANYSEMSYFHRNSLSNWWMLSHSVENRWEAFLAPPIAPRAASKEDQWDHGVFRGSNVLGDGPNDLAYGWWQTALAAIMSWIVGTLAVPWLGCTTAGKRKIGQRRIFR